MRPITTLKNEFYVKLCKDWGVTGKKFQIQVVYFAANGLYKMFFYIILPSDFTSYLDISALILTIYFQKVLC